MDVKRAVLSGQISSVNLNNKVDEWCEKMAMSGTYVHHAWFEMAAQMLDSDVVIVPLHAFPGNPCHIISAGLLGHDGYGRDVRHGKNVPLFIGKYCNMTCLKLVIVLSFNENLSLSGYFEEEKHSDGHFQSIIPYRDSVILQLLRDQGGPDVAEILELPPYSGQYITVFFLYFYHIKCLIRFLFFMYVLYSYKNYS